MSDQQWQQTEAGAESPRSSTPPDELQHMLSPTTATPPTPQNENPFGDGSNPPSTPSHLPKSPPARSPSAHFISSPLNPATPSSPFARSRPGSQGSVHIDRLVSEEARALTSPFRTLGSQTSRGSMVLYRLATDDDGQLVPPKALGYNRDSVVSSSGDSIVSLSSDSKYPSGFNSHQRGLVPYAYDPAVDENDPPDEEDLLHDPTDEKFNNGSVIALRGVLNVGVLLALIAGLLCLFVFYPVLSYFRNNERNLAIDGNIRINATGQAAELFQMPELIDLDTPDNVKSRTGFDGEDYELVFSDEFNVDGRTFYPGDDPFWEAVDLWYWATNDQEWYDPGQVTTKDGHLVILLENVETNGLQYRSGMLQSWNKFCFTSGYIEVSLVLPGPDSNTKGYWPGAWTMGNLARPGYGATTDGLWPYTYDECDVGTFPNQTLKDGSGPAAALHSNASRSKYNYELSWLSGQRLSACTCPGEDHPGPTTSKGRGAPEIDIIEAEKNKRTNIGQVASQSAQFAPFTHDYLYGNATDDEFKIFNTSSTVPNTYRGSAVQQAVSGLTQLPDNMFQGSGQQFTPLGFEYWANPSNPDEGFITWQTNGQQTVRLGAAAMGPDQGTGGSGVGRRLIPEEPMSIVLNLGISSNWQDIDLTTMTFPTEMWVDYVRVYQRKGYTNVGCDPKDYPTAKYINEHPAQYTNAQLTTWNISKPRNSLYDGGC